MTKNTNTSHKKAKITGYKKGILLFVITSLLWSTSGVVIKMIKWNPIAIAGARSGIASIIILPFVLLTDKNSTKNTTGNLASKFSVQSLISALSFAVTVILFVTATKLTTAANAIILQYTAPIYTAIFSGIFLHEKSTPADILMSIIATGGIALCFFGKLGKTGLLGNILALISGMSFSLFYLSMRSQREKNTLFPSLLGNIIAFTASLPFIAKGLPDSKGLIMLLFLGIFQMGIPMITYSIGIKYITALDAILISNLEPVLNPIWTFIILGENPGIWTIAGGSIVISTIVLRQIINRDRYIST